MENVLKILKELEYSGYTDYSDYTWDGEDEVWEEHYVFGCCPICGQYDHDVDCRLAMAIKYLEDKCNEDS